MIASGSVSNSLAIPRNEMATFKFRFDVATSLVRLLSILGIVAAVRECLGLVDSCHSLSVKPKASDLSLNVFRRAAAMSMPACDAARKA